MLLSSLGFQKGMRKKIERALYPNRTYFSAHPAQKVANLCCPHHRRQLTDIPHFFLNADSYIAFQKLQRKNCCNRLWPTSDAPGLEDNHSHSRLPEQAGAIIENKLILKCLPSLCAGFINEGRQNGNHSATDRLFLRTLQQNAFSGDTGYGK